jgi:hypothetical protein
MHGDNRRHGTTEGEKRTGQGVIVNDIDMLAA